MLLRVSPQVGGWRGGVGRVPRGKQRGAGCHPMSDVAALASQDGAPGAALRTWRSLAISLPFQPLSCVEPRAAFPKASAPQVPRVAMREAFAGGSGTLELRWGSGASRRPPPPPSRCCGQSAAPRRRARARSWSRSRSAARLRVVGSASAQPRGGDAAPL